MQFTEYCSIDNSYREKTINAIVEQGYGNEEYVVLSKTDGANFSFITDGIEVKVASRNNIVDGTFFNCQLVIDKYKEEILVLFQYLTKAIQYSNNQQLISLQLYGELIGDGINNRVKYCRGREFIVFDLLITTDKISYYADYDLLLHLLKDFHFILAPEHFKGKLRDCLDYCTNNLTFNSLIPKLLNNEYKELEVNYEEGYVIKPIKYLTLRTGSRVILKCKSPNFKESSNKARPPAKVVTLTEEENIVLNKLSELVTESRVYSVVSKLGQLTTEDFGKVLGLYIKDIIDDYSKDNEVVISKVVHRQLNKRCADCIRSVWTKLL